MLIYVCAKIEQQNEREQVEALLQKLARDNLNTYICGAITFSYLPPAKDKEEAYRDIMREDLICACDKLLVITDLDENMRRDIYFAELLKIPIEYK